MAFALTVSTPGLSYPEAYIKFGHLALNARDFKAELVFDAYQSKAAADAYRNAVLAGETPNPTDYIIANCERRVGIGTAAFLEMMKGEVGVGMRALAYQFAATQPAFEGAVAA